MQDDLITADNLNMELLKSVFDAAYLDSHWDASNHLVVQDKVKVRVTVEPEKEKISFLTIFTFKSHTHSKQSGLIA